MMKRREERGEPLVSTRGVMSWWRAALPGGRESYCEVYEWGVRGVTAQYGGISARKFELGYAEITNVSRAGSDRFYLFTAWDIYEVQARENRDEAVKEIKKRVGG